LRARGWRIEVAAWAAPNVRQARAYALVDDLLAIRRLLRVSPAGWSGAVRGRRALAMTRHGLVQIVCREGILLARTPQ
jgi:hypothetical protein